MRRYSHSLFALALLAFAAIASRPAKADYVYTFTSDFGTIQISNPELLANGSFNVPVTFIQGSGTLDFTEANQFDFVNGQTSTGTISITTRFSSLQHFPIRSKTFPPLRAALFSSLPRAETKLRSTER
jgi:hypothetical protein